MVFFGDLLDVESFLAEWARLFAGEVCVVPEHDKNFQEVCAGCAAAAGHGKPACVIYKRDKAFVPAWYVWGVVAYQWRGVS